MAEPTKSKRVQKELRNFLEHPPPGLFLQDDYDLKRWTIAFKGAKGTVYDDENYALQFQFSPKYPFEPPEVIFTGNAIPVHPHVYSNGHICLNILYDQWTPALSVQSICLSIVSMLSSAKKKELPPDNAQYVRAARKSPKDTLWAYHDDTV
eukprot:CFRG3130T1